MEHQPYFPKDLLHQILWFETFGSGLTTLGSKYGLSTGQVDALKADIDYVGFWFGVHKNLPLFTKEVTAFVHETLHGVNPGHTASAEPVFSGLGGVPPSVAPGVLIRILAAANAIKANVAYNKADGEFL